MTQEELINNMEQSGYIKNNDITVVEIEEGKKAVLKGIISDKSLNPYNVAHGGFIFGLGDTAMGVAAATTKRQAVTMSSTINYLKPSIGSYLTAEAKVIKSGKSICYLQTNIYNDKKELVATMDGNYFYIN
jgi:acyl-CoA thioesterase